MIKVLGVLVLLCAWQTKLPSTKVETRIDFKIFMVFSFT
jgi:hypothetical protein